MVDFLKNLKLSLKYLQLSEIMSIFAHRTMDVFHLLGLGCPRSEELSGSWRLFFYTQKEPSLFFVYNKNVAHNQHFFKKKLLGNSKKHKPMTVMTDDSFLNLRRKELLVLYIL